MSEMDYWSALAKHAEIRVLRSMHSSRIEQTKEQKGGDKMSTKLVIMVSSDDDRPLKDDEIQLFAKELSYWAHADWGYRAYVDDVIDTTEVN